MESSWRSTDSLFVFVSFHLSSKLDSFKLVCHADYDDDNDNSAQSMCQRPLERYTSIEETRMFSLIFRFALNLYLRFQSVDFNDPSEIYVVAMRRCWLWPQPPPQKAFTIFTYRVWWLPFHAGNLNAHAFMDLWMRSLQPWSHQFFSVNSKRRRHD